MDDIFKMILVVLPNMKDEIFDEEDNYSSQGVMTVGGTVNVSFHSLNESLVSE